MQTHKLTVNLRQPNGDPVRGAVEIFLTEMAITEAGIVLPIRLRKDLDDGTVEFSLMALDKPYRIRIFGGCPEVLRESFIMPAEDTTLAEVLEQ